MSDTFGRVADDELANIIDTATREEAGGKRPHTWGLVRSALLELQQHRARIAAHAADLEPEDLNHLRSALGGFDPESRRILEKILHAHGARP